jgi:catechol 2,3-dioxygenase-like lactoylglutathione lyase family enzyme
LITGVNDVYYNVEDMERAVRFYRDVLGLRVVDQNPYWTSLDVGGVRIGLHWTEGGKIPYVARDDHGPHAGACLTLRTDDIRSTVAQLRGRGVRFLGDVTDAEWGSLATFEDVDGNVLKLMQNVSRGGWSNAGPPPLAAPTNAPPQACFKCGGSGKLHRTTMPHSQGCIFCTNCDGCHASGVITATAARCPHCNGEGRVHHSSMPHSVDCIFCKKCGTCHGKGHVV